MLCFYPERSGWPLLRLYQSRNVFFTVRHFNCKDSFKVNAAKWIFRQIDTERPEQGKRIPNISITVSKDRQITVYIWNSQTFQIIESKTCDIKKEMFYLGLDSPQCSSSAALCKPVIQIIHQNPVKVLWNGRCKYERLIGSDIISCIHDAGHNYNCFPGVPVFCVVDHAILIKAEVVPDTVIPLILRINRNWMSQKIRCDLPNETIHCMPYQSDHWQVAWYNLT